jgi:hypothetical protein
MTTTPFPGTPPHCTDKPWTEAVRGGATTPLATARSPSQPDHPFDTHNPFTTLQPPHDDSTDDGSGQSANILLTPADGDIVATVSVLNNIVANVDGARDIATIGTIAAQMNRVDAAAPNSTLDGAFGERTTGIIRFGVRNELRYDKREATDNPTDGDTPLGGRTTSKIRFRGHHPIKCPPVVDVDAAGFSGPRNRWQAHHITIATGARPPPRYPHGHRW